ncbi:MAG: hypothetical protein J4F28_01210 [Nitrosopumilaceae archaeon]|nr:hypothetical protein [Nitrosopumilaceae archaeon]
MVGRKAALLPEVHHLYPDAVVAVGAVWHAVNPLRPHNGSLPNSRQSGPPGSPPPQALSDDDGAKDLQLEHYDHPLFGIRPV